MAGSFCDYLENAVLNYTFGLTTFTPIATMYVGLSTTDPTDTGTITGEPTIGSNSYARVAVTNDHTNWAVSTAGSLHNDVAITFPTASGTGWGTCTHFFISDAVTAGNIYAHAELTASKTIDPGDTASFAIGALVITLT